MKKEIVWVFGTSGSGKEMFIRNVYSNPGLLKKLGWTASSLVVCESSLNNIGQFDNDPITTAREQILTESPRLLSDADTVLIKWQLVDTEASRPERLKALLPETRHRIIELRAPKDELAQRLEQKRWWHDYGYEYEFINKELKLVADTLGKMGDDFEHIVLDSGSHGSYAIVG